MREYTTREEWDKLTPDEQYQYFYWSEFSVHQYECVMEVIPECPSHGHLCTSHAIEWIKSQLNKDKVTNPNIPMNSNVDLQEEFNKLMAEHDRVTGFDAMREAVVGGSWPDIWAELSGDIISFVSRNRHNMVLVKESKHD